MSSKEIVGEPADGWVGARPLRQTITEYQTSKPEDHILYRSNGVVSFGNWGFYREFNDTVDLVEQIHSVASVNPNLLPSFFPVSLLQVFADNECATTGSGKVAELKTAMDYVWGYSTKNLTGWKNEPTILVQGWRFNKEERKNFNRLTEEYNQSMLVGRDTNER